MTPITRGNEAVEGTSTYQKIPELHQRFALGFGENRSSWVLQVKKKKTKQLRAKARGRSFLGRVW